MILYTIGPNVNIDNVIIEEDEKKYLFIPTGCGEGISGPDVSKVKYEEVNGSKNIHVCI